MSRHVRTGWITESRRCPIHGNALELWFDETDFTTWRGTGAEGLASWEHDDNRIGWRCERCLGVWLENHFSTAAREAPRERLIVTCTACGSRRVTHDCEPECCSGHRCLDCEAGYDVDTRVVEAGRPVAERRTRRAENAVQSGPIGAAERSGQTRPFRRCPRDPSHGLLELVLLDAHGADPRPLGWACDACARTWTETWFRALRLEFVAEVSPAVLCAHCAARDVRPTERGLRCDRCDALLELRIVRLPPRRQR